MDGSQLLPLILLADKPNQKALFAPIVSAMIPGQQSRLLVAAVTAKKQIKVQAETEKLHADTEKQLVQEAIWIGSFKSAAEFDRFGGLLAAFKRLSPSDQITVFQTPPPGGGGTKSGGNG